MRRAAPPPPFFASSSAAAVRSSLILAKSAGVRICERHLLAGFRDDEGEKTYLGGREICERRSLQLLVRTCQTHLILVLVVRDRRRAQDGIILDLILILVVVLFRVCIAVLVVLLLDDLLDDLLLLDDRDDLALLATLRLALVFAVGKLDVGPIAGNVVPPARRIRIRVRLDLPRFPLPVLVDLSVRLDFCQMLRQELRTRTRSVPALARRKMRNKGRTSRPSIDVAASLDSPYCNGSASLSAIAASLPISLRLSSPGLTSRYNCSKLLLATMTPLSLLMRYSTRSSRSSRSMHQG